MTNDLPEVATPARPGAAAATDALARRWWTAYCGPNRDAANRARLRRSRTPLEALLVPATLELARWLGVRAEREDSAWRTAAVADLARVLSHIRQDTPGQAPMRAAGWKSFPGDRKESEAGGDRPRLAEARFRRLLQSDGGDELVTSFTRLIALLGDAADVGQIARDFLDWSHPARGDAVRRRWAVDYYAAAWPAAPDESTPTKESDA